MMGQDQVGDKCIVSFYIVFVCKWDHIRLSIYCGFHFLKQMLIFFI